MTVRKYGPIGNIQSKHYPTVRALLLQGWSHKEIAKKIGIKTGTVTDIAPRISALPSQDYVTYRLNWFIRRFNLNTTVEKLKRQLETTVEEPITRRAKKVGVQPYHLRRLLVLIPAFKLSSREVAVRQLNRLKETGVPVHNTTFMQANHKLLLDRARRVFGNYWLALRTVGVDASPLAGGRPHSLNAIAKPLTLDEREILLKHLAGTSIKKIAQARGVQFVEIERAMRKIRGKVRANTELSRKLARLAHAEEELQKMEEGIPPSAPQKTSNGGLERLRTIREAHNRVRHRLF